MRLHDSIFRRTDGTTHRAYVYMQSAGAESIEEDQRRVYLQLEEQPRAIVGANSTGWTPGDLIEWRAKRYEVRGVLPRMKRGRVHHYTLDLAQPPAP